MASETVKTVSSGDKAYTVCIQNVDLSCAPWITTFSSREKMDRFKKLVMEVLEAADKTDQYAVGSDSGEVDCEDYLHGLIQDVVGALR